MHVEIPKGGLKTAKEFLGEYSMIVVSILTALALEHAAQSWHHSHRAHDAEEKIESELRHNLDELHKITEANDKQYKRLEEFRVALRNAIKSEKAEDKAVFNELMKKPDNHFGLNLKSPTLRREAWEVAVASQSASWMSPALLQRYSGLYAQQRETGESVTLNIQLMLNGPAMINTMSSVELGKIDPTALYHTIRQMQGAIDGVQDNLRELEKEMGATLNKA